MIADHYEARALMKQCRRKYWREFRAVIMKANDIITAAGAHGPEHVEFVPGSKGHRKETFHLSPFAAYVVLEIGDGAKSETSQLYLDVREEARDDREKFPFCIIDGCFRPGHLWRDIHREPIFAFTFCDDHRDNAIAVLGDTFAEGYARAQKAVAA